MTRYPNPRGQVDKRRQKWSAAARQRLGGGGNIRGACYLRPSGALVADARSGVQR